MPAHSRIAVICCHVCAAALLASADAVVGSPRPPSTLNQESARRAESPHLLADDIRVIRIDGDDSSLANSAAEPSETVRRPDLPGIAADGDDRTRLHLLDARRAIHAPLPAASVHQPADETYSSQILLADVYGAEGQRLGTARVQYYDIVYAKEATNGTVSRPSRQQSVQRGQQRGEAPREGDQSRNDPGNVARPKSILVAIAVLALFAAGSGCGIAAIWAGSEDDELYARLFRLVGCVAVFAAGFWLCRQFLVSTGRI